MAKLSLDFGNPVLGPLDEEQAIELLKILRISIQKLDLHLVSLIHSDGLAKAEAKRLFSHESTRMNKLVAHERSEKLRRELWSGYHIRANDAELIEAVQTYGIKV